MNKIFESKGDKGYRIEYFDLGNRVELVVMNRNNNRKYTRSYFDTRLLNTIIEGCNNNLGSLVSFATNVNDKQVLEKLKMILKCEKVYYKEPY